MFIAEDVLYIIINATFHVNSIDAMRLKSFLQHILKQITHYIYYEGSPIV